MDVAVQEWAKKQPIATVDGNFMMNHGQWGFSLPISDKCNMLINSHVD
jgi:hypothetical protein